MMRGNRMRAGVERGEVQIGTWVTFVRTPSILMLLQAAGADYARVDMEHTGTSVETVGEMAAMARALDFPIAVRPPVANREWITRLLDVGVWNIHCPQVESAKHAAEIVAASRYAPWGLRGNGGLSASTEFNAAISPAERRAFANREVFITAMIETADAFKELDEIAGMKGIDALTLGPADLAQDLGVFGKPEQGKVINEKRDLILDAARRHGKTCAMLCFSPEEVQKWKEAGALLLAYSSDVEILHKGFSDAMKKLKG
jgi:2-keto-3-deoxy-L-rhamnonate aldolase RhmA